MGPDRRGSVLIGGQDPRWVERRFGEGARPSAILLTHGHFDHVGALKELASQWDVPVYAHPLEMPYLTGRSKYPPPDPAVDRGAMSLLSPLYPRGPIDISDRIRELPADGSVPGLPGWRWIHTPGHRAGHVSFPAMTTGCSSPAMLWSPRNRSRSPRCSRSKGNFTGPAYYTSDWDAAEQSVDRLAGLQPSVVACGHGLPVAGADALNGLEILSRNFYRTERPLRGRYVPHPAVTNERGVVFVPPAPAQSVGLAMLAAGAIGVGLGMYYSSRRRA